MPTKEIPPSQALLLDNQLCFDLYSASLAMTKLYKPLLAQLGLTYPQYVVMLVLWEADGVMVSDIGARLFLDSGTLTPLLKRLEAAGLLGRKRDAEDERRVRVTLTSNGRALKKQAAAIPACVAALAQCELPEIRSLSKGIKSLRARLLS